MPDRAAGVLLRPPLLMGPPDAPLLPLPLLLLL